MDLIRPPLEQRLGKGHPAVDGLHPIGRLDAQTEGLLLLTNDGSFTQALTHPRHRVPKLYVAEVRGLPSEDALDRIRTGIPLFGRRTLPARARIVREDRSRGTCTVEVELREGRQQQVRRMFQAVGFPVNKLMRSAVGPVTLSRMKRGQWRFLTEAEVDTLRKMAEEPESHADAEWASDYRPRPETSRGGRPAARNREVDRRTTAGRPPGRAPSGAGRGPAGSGRFSDARGDTRSGGRDMGAPRGGTLRDSGRPQGTPPAGRPPTGRPPAGGPSAGRGPAERSSRERFGQEGSGAGDRSERQTRGGPAGWRQQDPRGGQGGARQDARGGQQARGRQDAAGRPDGWGGQDRNPRGRPDMPMPGGAAGRGRQDARGPQDSRGPRERGSRPPQDRPPQGRPPQGRSPQGRPPQGRPPQGRPPRPSGRGDA